MREFLKKIFCKHKNNEVVCWHWTHGYATYNPRIIEIQYKCNDCGKYYFGGITNWNKCKKFAAKYKDKQWSDTCKPVL